MSTEPFRQTEEKFFRLKGQLATGRISREQFEAALRDLMIQDQQGRRWILGTDSGKWQVHNGTEWVEADPFISNVGLLPPAPRPPTELPERGETVPRPFTASSLPPPRPSTAPPSYSAPSATPPPRRGCNCLGTGCLAIVVVFIALCGIGSAFYFHVPQQFGLFGTTPERVLSTVPDRGASAELKAELVRAGIDTRGMDIYILPLKNKPGSVAYVVLDSSAGFHFASNSRDPIFDYFKQLASGQTAKKYGLDRVAIEYKSPTGATLLNLTAPTAAITAFANGSQSRSDFLKKVDGQANWPALYQEMVK
jgi:hypothetical protein